ncbi:MAG: HNH endonuclease [Anaerolineales bacterium]|nr:HNH endonuclease [Anaerolineales bacterium]
MSRRYITANEQKTIIERAQRRCEYCRCPMDIGTQSFEFEHIQPVHRGGATTLENLALACGGCNNHKFTKIEALDPLSQTIVPLYHPRQQQWHDHFGWNDDFTLVIGLTAVGRATINALNLNRPGVVNMRRLLRMAGKHP